MKKPGKFGLKKRLIGYPAVLGVLLLVLWLVSIRMPGSSYAGALPPLSAAADSSSVRMRAHVEELAGRIGERDATHVEQLDAAAAYITAQFAGLGLAVVRRPYLIGRREYANIEATLRGTSDSPEVVVVGAHYDAVIDTPGADDNASGVACLLEVARMLRERPLARTVRFVAFANEEPPLFWTEDMGSLRYAREIRARNNAIVAMLSLETLGFYSDSAGSQRYPPILGWFYPDRGDFVAFVGNIGSRWLVHRAIATFRKTTAFPSQGSAAPTQIPGIGWSDHWSFWKTGYDAIMISDTAPFRNGNYHLQTDQPQTLDYPRMARVAHGIATVIEDLAMNGREQPR